MRANPLFSARSDTDAESCDIAADGRMMCGFLRHTRTVDEPFDQATAEAAEARGDWATAIAMVGAYAECYSKDHHRHNAHLWHVDLLAKAGCLQELTEYAVIDVHARRRLQRLRSEQGDPNPESAR